MLGTPALLPAATVAVSISGGSVLSDADTNGWRFQALTNINVVSLGVWDEGSDGLPSTVQVGLWTDGGTLLGSLTVASGTAASLAGGFRYETLSSAIALAAGQFYRIGASPTTGVLQYREGVAVVSSSAIAYDDGYYAGSSNSLTFPSRAGTRPNFPDFFGPNFQYDAVPEPGTAFLVGLGLAALALLRRQP